MPLDAKLYQNVVNSNVRRQLPRESVFVCSMVANPQGQLHIVVNNAALLQKLFMVEKLGQYVIKDLRSWQR